MMLLNPEILDLCARVTENPVNLWAKRFIFLRSTFTTYDLLLLTSEVSLRRKTIDRPAWCQSIHIYRK